MWIPKNAQEIEVTALRGDPYARIRTAAELPISADLVDGQPYRKYAALAERSRHLTELGMTQAEIAVALKTTPRTIRRALRVRKQL